MGNSITYKKLSLGKICNIYNNSNLLTKHKRILLCKSEKRRKILNNISLIFAVNYKCRPN